ncbi:hypothetical protein MMC11_003955 [Xylographa trunciseda]|nr:hypothetical protein [Xylographa trunciseda]
MNTLRDHKYEVLLRPAKPIQSIQCTPCIGTEFPEANLVEWLRSPNSDELISELAIIIAERGVVFFRAQTELTSELQKELIRRLGQLSGRPKENGLYKHPLTRMLGEADPEIGGLSNSITRQMYSTGAPKQTSPRVAKWILGTSRVNWTGLSNKLEGFTKTRPALRKLTETLNRSGIWPAWHKRGNAWPEEQDWHSDSTFEQNPPDFSSLKLTQPPQGTKETLWASGYELYDRLPEKAKQLLECLTVTCSQPVLRSLANAKNSSVFQGPRGSPNNLGTAMEAVHPMVRTHPVTGWKSVFAVGTEYLSDDEDDDESGHMLDEVVVNELAADEGRLVLDKVMSLIKDNHDLQVRFQWRNPSDMGMYFIAQMQSSQLAAIKDNILISTLMQQFGTTDAYSTPQHHTLRDLAIVRMSWALARNRTWTRKACQRLKHWQKVK